MMIEMEGLSSSGDKCPTSFCGIAAQSVSPDSLTVPLCQWHDPSLEELNRLVESQRAQ